MSSNPLNVSTQLRDDLLTRAAALFGPVEPVKMEAAGFPAAFQKLLKQSKTTCVNEIVAASCSASNVCAIVVPFNDAAALREILTANPWLHETVWTTWQGILFIWFNVTGWRPRSCALPGFAWISEGVLPAVELAGPEFYPDGFPVKDKGGILKTVTFEQFSWAPEIHELFLREKMIRLHGQVFRTVPGHRVVVNVETVAQFAATLLGLQYSRREATFTTRYEPGTVKLLQKSALADLIAEWLNREAVKAGVKLPAGDPVAAIITRLEQRCAAEFIDAAEGFRIFLRERIECKTGASLTTREAWAGYRGFCKQLGAICYPERAFYTHFAGAVKMLFGVCRAHDIERGQENGGIKSAYGYRNLAVRAAVAEPSEPSEAAEAAEPVPR